MLDPADSVIHTLKSQRHGCTRQSISCQWSPERRNPKATYNFRCLEICKSLNGKCARCIKRTVVNRIANSVINLIDNDFWILCGVSVTVVSVTVLARSLRSCCWRFLAYSSARGHRDRDGCNTQRFCVDSRLAIFSLACSRSGVWFIVGKQRLRFSHTVSHPSLKLKNHKTPQTGYPA